MIKVENIETWGFQHAIRAMRNPMDSWDKSDSHYCDEAHCKECNLVDEGEYDSDLCDRPDGFYLGENDLSLMRRLNKAGVEHRTYARMMMVSMDITAPLYWWKEADRYRFKEQVSCSTMHRVHAKEFTLADFSHEHLTTTGEAALLSLIGSLNDFRNIYLAGRNKVWWWQLIQLLPSSYNQKRTVMMSYETAMKMIRERRSHKLGEWQDLVRVLEGLPYMAEITEE